MRHDDRREEALNDIEALVSERLREAIRDALCDVNVAAAIRALGCRRFDANVRTYVASIGAATAQALVWSGALPLCGNVCGAVRSTPEYPCEWCGIGANQCVEEREGGRKCCPDCQHAPAMPPTDPDDDSAAAVAAGMTPREAEVWRLVSRAAGAYLRLTVDEPQHGMEREEVCHAFHVVQGWLAGRPFIRAMGYERTEGDGDG